MNINFTIEINRPIDFVWNVLAEDFVNIHKWYGPVKNSYDLDSQVKLPGASCAGRVCELSDKPDGLKASETITVYDKANHLLELNVQIIDSPAIMPINGNYAIFQLSNTSSNQTVLSVEVEPRLKMHGYILYPLIKIGISMEFKKMLQAFKNHTEKLAFSAA